ncbi:MAG: hypothetical protein ACYC4U_08730 [Pirellulaceae bacterium]
MRCSFQWRLYTQTFDAKTELTENEIRRIIDLCHLITYADDAESAEELGNYIKHHLQVTDEHYEQAHEKGCHVPRRKKEKSPRKRLFPGLSWFKEWRIGGSNP